jgi:hypothetical protein
MLTAVPGGYLLKVHLVPKAGKNQIVGPYGNALKIKIAAPPIDGAANIELCRFIADKLGLPKSAVRLVHGTTSRQKTLHIATTKDLRNTIFLC